MSDRGKTISCSGEYPKLTGGAEGDEFAGVGGDAVAGNDDTCGKRACATRGVGSCRSQAIFFVVARSRSSWM